MPDIASVIRETAFEIVNMFSGKKTETWLPVVKPDESS